MSGETSANGSSARDGLTAAERLMQQHAAEDAHKATVEEVPDEETLLHPPPSSLAGKPTSDHTESIPATTKSAKAAEKQPAREKTIGPTLDTQSEELFPSLGAPKSQAMAASTTWARKPAVVSKAANGGANGIANGQKSPSKPVSGASPPISPGIATPVSSIPSQRGPMQLNLPGRYSESISLNRSQMLPRNQLRKPLPDIIREVNKRSKANVEMRNGPGDTMIFEGTGPVDDVRRALKEVATQLCPRQTLQLPVPASIRGRVVGKQGATITAIQKKSGAKINISRQEAAEILEDDDLDNTVDVMIEGDFFAVQLAKQEIENIVKEHKSSINARLKHIPAEYYPFLSPSYNLRLNELQQARDLRMQIPNYHTWKDQAPQQPAVARQPVAFAPQSSLPIHLAGDPQAVAEARVEIDRQVQELQAQLTMESLAMERGRHQFIVGDLGASLNDFLAETGCSVVLPPDHVDSEDILLIGPPERIEDGINKVMELAANMQMANVDAAKAHAKETRDASAHARHIMQYLQQREAIKELETMHKARIIADSTGSWQIYAKDGKDAMKARADVVNLINGHPPSRFSPVQVDPFYHSYLREQIAAQVRDQFGVRVVLPEEPQEEIILLVYEDRAPSPDYELPKRQPTAQDAQRFQQALQEARKHIQELTRGRPEIVSQDIDAPIKFHDKIRRYVDKHHQGKPDGYIPVQVTYGGAKQQQKRAAAHNLQMRGPQDSVDELVTSLRAFIDQEKRDEEERGFTLSFDFPQKFANHLIGRKGENINRLREEFDVDIQLQDDVCTIKGPEAKAIACKKHIVDMAKKLEDETTHHINIPPQFHRDLIGPQGSQVNRLQDRYNVRVQFPRTKQGDDDNSEAGDAATSRRTTQAPNEVVIKGPSRGADACRDELLSLLQYVRDISFTATVSVAQNQLPSLIGAGGREMEALRLDTGAYIDVPSAKETADSTGRAEIKIKGSKAAVEQAKRLIEERAKVFDNTVIRTMEVDRKHHRLIIGAHGANLKSLISAAGGPEDVRSQSRMIRFPRTDAEGNTIRIEGQKPTVDKICAAIEQLVGEQESQTTDIAEVKAEKHRLLIGRGGETRKQLEQKFNVSINVPRQTDTGPTRSQVRIAGQPDAVAKCKEHILEITKDAEGETVSVPRRLHHAIADGGQFFRRLRNDHKVTVDHGGQRPPAKPATTTSSRGNASGMPLITDEPLEEGGRHSFITREIHSAEEGEIAWVLSGPSPEAIAAAKSKLEEAIEEAGKQDTLGLLILEDPRAYRHVVGPGGSEINRIRRQTGTRIQVPKDQSKGEAIEIAGAESGVLEARDEILRVVKSKSS